MQPWGKAQIPDSSLALCGMARQAGIAACTAPTLLGADGEGDKQAGKGTLKKNKGSPRSCVVGSARAALAL